MPSGFSAFVFSCHGLQQQQSTGKSLILIERSVHSDSETPSSILILRLSSLGDVILATPVVRALRARFPQARIDVAVAREFAEVWRGNTNVSAVLELDKRRSALHGLRLDALPGALSRYDVVVDLQNNLRSFVLRWRFGTRRLVVDSMRKEKQALVAHAPGARALPHVVERYFRAVEPLGVRDDGNGLDMWAADGSTVSDGSVCGKQQSAEPEVMVAPGAKHATKRWPATSFARCAEALIRQGFRVVVVGADADAGVCEEVVKNVDAVFVHGIRRVAVRTLDETMRIMNGVACVVANDSSIVHLAAARKVPVIDIFGSTVPALGFTPFRSEHTVIETMVECRPCTHIGRDGCPKGHFRCMNGIDVALVVEAALRYLRESPPRDVPA